MDQAETDHYLSSAHAINQELTIQQAIQDKTEMVMKELEDEQRQVDAIPINNEDDNKEDLDELDDFEAMDEEEEKLMRSIKEQRLAQMKEDYTETQTNKTLGHGSYDEIEEAAFLPTVTKTQYVIVHFYHNDFERCKIMDMHLAKIAPAHTETRIVKLDAEKAPFFIGKLSIQTLPTLVLFEDGIAIDRIIGFEELGEEDDFPTMNLIRVLVKRGMLLPKNKSEKGAMSMKRRGGGRNDSEDDDY